MKSILSKSSLIIYCVLLILGISFIIFICRLDISSESTDLSGNLFDKNILDSYELSWLERPENVYEERQYIYADTYYVYECEFNEFKKMEDYVERIFNNFIEKNYTVAYFVRNSESEDPSQKTIIKSENFSDYKTYQNNQTVYSFYYFNRTYEELIKHYSGTRVDCRPISFVLNNIQAENGLYNFSIKFHAKLETSFNIICP